MSAHTREEVSGVAQSIREIALVEGFKGNSSDESLIECAASLLDSYAVTLGRDGRVVSDEDVERAADVYNQIVYGHGQPNKLGKLAMRKALESLPAVKVPDGWRDMPCYVIHPSNVDDEKKPLHKIDFGMELDGTLIFTSKYVPNGETTDAVAYIRDWTPDCVREYVAALKQAIQDADSALDEAEEGLLFASNARQPTKLGRDRSRERLHFVQGIRKQIKPLLAAAPNPNDTKEQG